MSKCQSVADMSRRDAHRGGQGLQVLIKASRR
jgi:hypothetical protein